MRRNIRQAVQRVGLTCVAGAAWYITLPTAQAAVIYTQIGGPLNTTGNDNNIDLNGDGIYDIDITVANGSDVFVEPLHDASGFGHPGEFGGSRTPGGASSPASGDNYNLYSPGQTISHSGSFRASVSRPLSDLTGKKYVGIAFEDGNTDYGGGNVGNTVLGQFALSYDNGVLTLSDVAYQTDPNGDITVPEPGSLASLAVGAAGLLARRRKRTN